MGYLCLGIRSVGGCLKFTWVVACCFEERGRKFEKGRVEGARLFACSILEELETLLINHGTHNMNWSLVLFCSFASSLATRPVRIMTL